MVDVFSGSPHESDAREFESRGVTFRARKPACVQPTGVDVADESRERRIHAGTAS